MFHTEQSDFSIQRSPYSRDIVREFIDAMRSVGIQIGLYFSLIDWHHPDYPAFTEADKPSLMFLVSFAPPTPEQWQRFTQFMFGQVRELLTNYGNIDNKTHLARTHRRLASKGWHKLQTTHQRDVPCGHRHGGAIAQPAAQSLFGMPL